MSIKKHPYTGCILKPYATDITSDSQSYKTILTVSCDIETMLEESQSDPYVYTHKIWWWNDAMVTFNGVSMSWKAYLELDGRIPITEGLYFKANVYDKTISGQIKIYSPSQIGVMLGIDKNVT